MKHAAYVFVGLFVFYAGKLIEMIGGVFSNALPDKWNGVHFMMFVIPIAIVIYIVGMIYTIVHKAIIRDFIEGG